MQSINLILIGLGPHAKRIYIPGLLKLRKYFNINLKLVVDLESQLDSCTQYLSTLDVKPEIYTVKPFNDDNGLPDNVAQYLSAFTKQQEINGVIIATEPLVHKPYAMWALKHNLNILMDKPISTRRNVSHKLTEADGVYVDYIDLLNEYNKTQERKKTIFSINVQRRYHPGQQFVLEKIKEVAKQFNMPVTSIQSSHADGQWRLPNEIVEQGYHPYSQGYGKCSHSGYHFFDILWQYYQSGLITKKTADRLEVISSFILPRGFLKQITRQDYINYFGQQYNKHCPHSDKTLYQMCRGFGEMDAAIIIRFIQDEDAICQATLNLQHNTFARRTWLKPGKDLYKGNGRVKHEHHIIQQGPFQCIQIHSYQSKDKHDSNSVEDFQVGGNNHFDVSIYRNSEMFNSNETPFKIYSIDEILVNSDSTHELLYEKTKLTVIQEFIEFIQGSRTHTELKSNIDSHAIPVNLMSATYRSEIQLKQHRLPMVNINLNQEHYYV